MTITFVVKGEPRPKQSFRYTKNGGGFTSARVKEWQETVAWESKIAMKGKDLLEGSFYITLNFRLGNKRRVDLDNLSKCVLDAMNGIVYKDDTEVVKLNLHKTVSDDVGVSVYVSILKT